MNHLTRVVFSFLAEKIEALEDKIKAEMATLKEKMVKMEEEIETFSDLDKLRREAEEKRRCVLGGLIHFVGLDWLVNTNTCQNKESVKFDWLEQKRSGSKSDYNRLFNCFFVAVLYFGDFLDGNSPESVVVNVKVTGTKVATCEVQGGLV